MPDQLGVCEPAPRDGREDRREAAVVAQFAQVVGEQPLVQIAEQVERLDADVGAMQTALQQAPEVFDGVGVGVPVHVLNRVVDDFVRVISIETLVGRKLVAEDALDELSSSCPASS